MRRLETRKDGNLLWYQPGCNLPETIVNDEVGYRNYQKVRMRLGVGTVPRI